MKDILALRDNETGKTLELRELGEAEDVAELFGAKRQQYPPPRYELMIGVAADLETFLKNYPRFARGTGGGGDGDPKAQPAREAADHNAPGAQRGGGKD